MQCYGSSPRQPLHGLPCRLRPRLVLAWPFPLRAANQHPIKSRALRPSVLYDLAVESVKGIQDEANFLASALAVGTAAAGFVAFIAKNLTVAELSSKFDKMDNKFDKIDNRFDQQNSSFLAVAAGTVVVALLAIVFMTALQLGNLRP